MLRPSPSPSAARLPLPSCWSSFTQSVSQLCSLAEAEGAVAVGGRVRTQRSRVPAATKRGAAQMASPARTVGSPNPGARLLTGQTGYTSRPPSPTSEIQQRQLLCQPREPAVVRGDVMAAGRGGRHAQVSLRAAGQANRSAYKPQHCRFGRYSCNRQSGGHVYGALLPACCWGRLPHQPTIEHRHGGYAVRQRLPAGPVVAGRTCCKYQRQSLKQATRMQLLQEAVAAVPMRCQRQGAAPTRAVCWTANACTSHLSPGKCLWRQPVACGALPATVYPCAEDWRKMGPPAAAAGTGRQL